MARGGGSFGGGGRGGGSFGGSRGEVHLAVAVAAGLWRTQRRLIWWTQRRLIRAQAAEEYLQRKVPVPIWSGIWSQNPMGGGFGGGRPQRSSGGGGCGCVTLLLF